MTRYNLGWSRAKGDVGLAGGVVGAARIAPVVGGDHHVLLLAGRVVAAGAPFDVPRPERLSEAFGITMVAVPHGDHHDLLETGHAHGHGERTTRDHG